MVRDDVMTSNVRGRFQGYDGSLFTPECTINTTMTIMAIMTIMKTILDSTNNPTTRTNNKHNTQPNKCIKTQIIANVTNRNKEEIRESGTEEEEEEGVHTQTGEPIIEFTRQTHKEIRYQQKQGGNKREWNRGRGRGRSAHADRRTDNRVHTTNTQRDSLPTETRR
eukprot:985273_1